MNADASCKACLICGKAISDRRRSYCSPECARIAEKERKHQRSTPLERTTPKTYHYITCPDCGAYVLRHIASTRCASCQKDAKRAQAQETCQRRAAGKARRIGEEYPCEVCGKPYVLAGGRQRYCPDCGPEQCRKNRNAASLAWNRREYATPEGRAKKIASQQGKPDPFIKTCDICGATFQAFRSNGRFCSPECAKVYRQQYAAEYYVAKREAISKKAHERYQKRKNEKDGE